MLRRLAALGYDLILISALLIVLTFPVLIFTEGQAIPTGTIYFQVYLLFIIYAFFTWFWCRGGQTLGLACWKLRLVNMQHQPVTLGAATLRFFLSILTISCGGIGLWWALFNAKQQTLYDKLSKTVLIRV